MLSPVASVVYIFSFCRGEAFGRQFITYNPIFSIRMLHPSLTGNEKLKITHYPIGP
jgi:hypothetical protein